VYYYYADHLGSTRSVVNVNPSNSPTDGSICMEVDYLPYGTENTPANFTGSCSSPPPFRYRFTGYERDIETATATNQGNDYAFARFYNSRLGRFMSGDPLDGHIDDPQTLNHYSYVRNNPVNLLDPSGMATWGGCYYVDEIMVCEYFSGGTADCDMCTGIRPIPPKQRPGPPKQPPKRSFWSRLRQHLGNLLGLHSWDFGMREVVTTRIVSGSTDVLGVVATVTDNAKLGAASAAISVLTDPSPSNIAINVLGLIPGPDVPISFGTAAYDGSQIAGQVMTDVFTPDASQGDYINNGNGLTIPNPDRFDQNGVPY